MNKEDRVITEATEKILCEWEHIYTGKGENRKVIISRLFIKSLGICIGKVYYKEDIKKWVGIFPNVVRSISKKYVIESDTRFSACVNLLSVIKRGKVCEVHKRHDDSKIMEFLQESVKEFKEKNKIV
jgi:hypothetical protein